MEQRKDAKIESLRQSGSLHPHPERVVDPLFQENEFFDRRDLVQVKYEMLRHVQHEGRSVAEAARSFGFSRVAFYQALRAFQKHGLPGLVRKRPGPKGSHKLTDAIWKFIEESLAANETLRSRELAKMVRKKFRVPVHPRTIERALTKRRKKGRQTEARKKRPP